MEKKTNIKLLPPPKFKNNEVVNINVAGTEQGKVIGKEAVGNENVLIVQKSNGEKLPILESEARKTDAKEIEIKLDGDKININNKQEKTFKSRQENNEFNKDIIELTKRWKKAVVELDNALRADAKKEFAATAQIGYGLDGDEKTKHSDFAAVRGIFEEDSFVSEIEEHITRKTALGDELISRMQKLLSSQ